MMPAIWAQDEVRSGGEWGGEILPCMHESLEDTAAPYSRQGQSSPPVLLANAVTPVPLVLSSNMVSLTQIW